jgi:hypothetical protein
MYSFETDPEFARMQKKTMMINDYLHRIKIYNNAIGHKCIPNFITTTDDAVDMIPLDTFEFENLSLLRIDLAGAEKLVIYGARKTIEKHKPVIF